MWSPRLLAGSLGTFKCAGSGPNLKPSIAEMVLSSTVGFPYRHVKNHSNRF